MVDFVVFFDFSTFRPGGKGIDGRFHLIFPTFRPGGRTLIGDFDFFRLFDLGGRLKKVDLIEFFRFC